MTRAKASGYGLTTNDARTVLGMQARGDRDHDIAAWWGVNQGRIADVDAGQFGTLEAASADKLPPKGPPGVKGKRLRASINEVLASLEKGDTQAAVAILQKAKERYDANEA
jgi:hypothetical protein